MRTGPTGATGASPAGRSIRRESATTRCGSRRACLATYASSSTRGATRRTATSSGRRSATDAITRRGGLIRWEQDGQLVLEMNERAPLPIDGHDRFGFSSWQNDTYFDNLKIDPL